MRRLPRFEPLEPRCMLSATMFEHESIGYFLNQTHSRLERYDIAGETWLTPVSVANPIGTPTVAHSDDDGIYVAYGKAVYRYDLGGGGQTHLLNAQDNVIAIHSDGNLLFLNHTNGYYARIISIDKTTNTIIDTIDNYIDAVYGSSIAPSVNRIFGRTMGISPSDITYVGYRDDGTFTGGAGSPYHGDYPGASTTWVFPNDSKVVDSSGTIYSTSGLTWLNSFGSSVTDVDFLGADIPIVLSGNSITAFTAAILPTGSAALSTAASKIFVNDTNVIAFAADASLSTGYRTEILPLSQLNPPTPGNPINPVGLPFTPDKIEQAADGTILLYSKSHQSIFRWDPLMQQYGATIPLIGTASFMAYSAGTNTAYLAYESGLIRKIDLDAPEPTEVPFTILPARPLGLATAGPYLFAVDGSGAWVSHYTFAPDGTLIDSVDWNYYSREYVWSASNQKMYFFRDDTSPNDLLWEEINADGTTYPTEPPGGIKAKVDSPLHTSSGFTHPIRVAPDGSVVVLGSGMIHDATTLQRNTMALPNAITDAAWIGGELFTVRNVAGAAQIQYWTQPTYGLGKVLERPGTAHSLIALPGDRLLAVTIGVDGIPAFTLMDENLNTIEQVAPVAASENSYRLSENVAFVGNVITDDTGAGADQPAVGSAALQVAAVNGGSAAVGVPVKLESGATLTVQADGSFRYDPRTSARLNGLMSAETFVETFEYTIVRGAAWNPGEGYQDSAVVTLVVEGNDEPFVGMVGEELIAGGTSAADRIQFFSPRFSSGVWVEVNGTRHGPFATPARLVAFGGEGDDAIRIGRGGVHVPAEFHGGLGHDRLSGSRLDDLLLDGNGNDQLRGGSGNDILQAGDGLDRLSGGSGRDLLIGGLGRDDQDGGWDEDILIGGTTDYDTNVAALLAILDEWSRNTRVANRIYHLKGAPGGMNDPYFLILGMTVHDDGEQDTLRGKLRFDWVPDLSPWLNE